MKNNYFYGIYGIKFVWHGAWADPELIWHKKSFNYYDLENTLWDEYREECNAGDKTTSEDGFAVWVKKNAHLTREILQEFLNAKQFYGKGAL